MLNMFWLPSMLIKSKGRNTVRGGVVSNGRNILCVILIFIEMCQNSVKGDLETEQPTLQTRWNTEHFPQIHSPKMKITVQKGDQIVLPCKVVNLGEHQILWRKDANILAGSNVSKISDDRIRLLADFSLELSKVTSDFEGKYICQVTSWPPLTLVHEVSVFDPPTINLIPAGGSIVISEGETAKMACIPNGNPLPSISWSKRNGSIPLHRSSLNSSRLILEKVSKTHTGLYVCSASNGIGRPAIGAVFVRVLHAPDIDLPLRRVYGAVNGKGKLVCFVNADPLSDVQWSIGGKSPVHFGGDRVQLKVNGPEYALVFNRVREIDFNVYSCTFNNSLGKDSRMIEFTGVPKAPVISTWQSSPDSNDPGTLAVTLFWAAESFNGLVDFKLMFRSSPIKLIYIRSSPQSTDKDKPDLPDGIYEDRVGQQSIWTELTIPADPASSSFIHTKSFTIRGLQNNTIYESTIKARNKFGWSFLSNVSYFSTFPHSLKRSEEIEEYITKLSSTQAPPFMGVQGGKQRSGFGILESPSGGVSSSSSQNSAALISGIFLPLITKYLQFYISFYRFDS